MVNNRNIGKISVLIPTRNGGETLAELMSMLSLQSVDVAEVVVADTSSTDNTVKIAIQYGAKVINVQPNEFDHGATRSLLARRATGELLIFFTQDAIPKTRQSLEELIAPIISDDSVATCYGRQLPAFNASHFGASLRRFNYPEVDLVRDISSSKHYGIKTIFTSNSFACYRKADLERIGFFKAGLIFGEDTIAVGSLLLSGKKIAYASEATVYHSHNYTPVQDFRRYFDIGILHYQEKHVFKKFGSAEGEGKKYIHHEIQELARTNRWYLIPELFYRIMLKYAGYRLGRRFKSLPPSIACHLSMHRKWWDNSSI